MIRRLVAGFAAGTLLALAACWSNSDDDDDGAGREPPAPAAKLVAGGGGTSPDGILPDSTSQDEPELVAVDDEVSDLDLADLDLSEAAEVVADVDGGYWVLASGVVFHVEEDRIDLAVKGPTMEHLAASPAGGVAVAASENVWVLAPGRDNVRYHPGFEEVGSVAVGNDGTVYASDREDSRINAWAPDQPDRHVLGANEDAETVPEYFGGIISLVALGDGSLAFVNINHEGPQGGTFELRVLSDGEIKPVESSAFEVDPDTESDAVPLMKIAEGLAGRLLAVDGQEIKLIDVGSEESEVLAELDGDPMPKSAAIDGTDLLFLAEGHLWRKPDVVG